MRITVGYPLGLTKTNEGCFYLVELKDKYVHLDYDQLKIWSQMTFEYVPQNDTERIAVDRLEALGLFIFSDDWIELIKLLLPHQYIRQGFGMMNSQGSYVYIGNKEVYLTERQMTIWQLGNGKNTIQTVAGYCYKNNIINASDLKLLLDDINFLCTNDLIYII